MKKKNVTKYFEHLNVLLNSWDGFGVKLGWIVGSNGDVGGGVGVVVGDCLGGCGRIITYS